MKTESFLCLVIAVFGLLTLSSCTVYVDNNGSIVGTGFQPVRAGFGFLPQSPTARGTVVLRGGATTGSLCQPGGPRIQYGYSTRQLPPQWGRVNPYPYGSRYSPGHPSNYPNFQQQCGYPNRAGSINGHRQPNWCPPNYGPRPGCYNPCTQRW